MHSMNGNLQDPATTECGDPLDLIPQDKSLFQPTRSQHNSSQQPQLLQPDLFIQNHHNKVTALAATAAIKEMNEVKECNTGMTLESAQMI